ncbi:MAG TPA: hypothetical protein PLJ00_11920, partial [Chitinophagales bacterium]|nr:hypothetical protein [Chitinophagales bacterium]HRH52583.1 hypothetical protein [Chitinophagales bacterium]
MKNKKNKSSKLAILLMMICLKSFGQAPGIEWQNTIGGTGGDYLQSISQTTDDGYIIGGYSYSGKNGDKTEPTQGNADYWVLKLNNAGSIQWQNTIGGNDNDLLLAVQQTSDGGYILGGYSWSGISDDKTEPAMEYDYWVVKLNNSGVIEWQNTIGGIALDFLTCLHQTADGGYILGGYAWSGISGDKTEVSQGGFDYWVVKLNSLGSIEWQNTIGGNGYDYLYSIKQTSDGGYIIGGESNSSISGDKTENMVGVPYNYDYWVLKLDNIGEIEWQNTIGGSNNDYLRCVQQTFDGGYILGGYSQSGLSGDKSESSLGSYDYWVVKLNNSGLIEWQNSLGGSSEDYLYSVQQTADSGYILGGNSMSGISFDKSEINFNGGQDYWVVKLNNSGLKEWDNTIGGDDIEKFTAIQQTTDGGFILGGSSWSYISGDKTEPIIGSYDYWVLKLEAPACAPVPETCNSLDDNCNGLIDDDITETISITAGGPITFCQGGNVLLTATYSGATVQWKKNGSNIPGATSVTYNVTTKGNYSCVTTSACGTAESTPIFVNVIKNPNASISAGGPTTFCAGGSVVLTEVAVAGCTYQWYK